MPVIPGTQLNTVVVTGTFKYDDGSPAKGKVVFTRDNVRLVDPTQNQIIYPLQVTADLDNTTGSFSKSLLVTNDPDYTITPGDGSSGWLWTVSEQIQGQNPYTYRVEVPLNTPGGTVDLADMPQAAPVSSGGSNTYVLLSSVGTSVPRLVGGTVPLDELGTGTPGTGKYVDGGTGQWTSLPPPSGGIASTVVVSPAGSIASTDVQAALEELDVEKATAAGLTGHLNDTIDAHDASAVSVVPVGGIAATTAQAAIAELDSEKLNRATGFYVIDAGGNAATARPSGIPAGYWINSPTQPTNMANGDVWDDPNAVATVLWDASDWSRFGTTYQLSTPDGTGTTGLTFTTSVRTDTNSNAPVGRVAHPGGATSGGGQRTFYLLDGTESVDSEVTSLIYARSDHPNGGQMGNVHRAQIDPATGRPNGYIVWYDVAFGLDWIMNINTWTTSTNSGANRLDVVQGTMTGYGQPTLMSVRNKVRVYDFTRSGTTMTLQVDPDHDVQVGDKLTLVGTSIDAQVTVTSLFGQSIITATHPSSGTTDSGTHQHAALNTTGGGHLHPSALAYNDRRSMPYFLKSRLTGTGSNTVLRFKAWRRGYAEPDWSDPLAVGRATGAGGGLSTPGKCGVMGGHLDTTGKFLEFGSIKVEKL